MELTAVIIDTVSNQEYIFSGNRLKENLGGSHLLKTAYREPLSESLNSVAKGNAGISGWPDGGDGLKLEGGAEVGYIGGGNALIFFDTPKRAEAFIGQFSRKLLRSHPGLKTAFGLVHPFDKSAFPIQSVFDALQAVKNSSVPRTLPPMHGITAACPYSGEAIELCRFDDDRNCGISALSFSRLLAADPGREELTSEQEERLQGLKFTDEIGRLGQLETNSYAAVVHIDGNGMGQRFKDCSSLGELRRLSATVSGATSRAFDLLVTDAVRVVKEFLKDDEGFNFDAPDGKKLVPFRPVIIGGDDITFVCEGRLGIFFAERFLKHIEFTSREAGIIHACAGVAIIKTKYPFLKAYRFAEELCAAAKQRSRNQDNASFLDFFISSGGFSGSIEHIRKKHFKSSEGRELHFGPYRCNYAEDRRSMTTLRKGIHFFQNKENWSRSQAMKLRELLTGPSIHCGNFVAANDLNLPDLPYYDDSAPLLKGDNPFYDMLDVMDFYPGRLLEEVEK